MSTHQMHRLIAFSALTASLLVPAIVRAQDAAPSVAISATEVVAPTTTTAAAVSTASTDGPRINQSGVTRSSVSAAPVAPPQFQTDRSNVAWMVVGGAALVVGSMIGGDAGTIIMITGGVIGLMGLFRYMQ
jgi:hypothetical protein